MAIVGLDHINIRTTDLAGTRAFFTGILGLKVGWRLDFPFGGAWLYAGDKDVIMDFAADGKPAAGRDPWGAEIDATTVARVQ